MSMQSYDECLYFIYPRNYDLKLQKQVLQGGFVASIKAPSLVEDGYVQTFTEEDVANFGIETLCKKTMAGSFESAIVVRIPKVYLGLDTSSQIDPTPIFSQLKKSPANNNVTEAYGPMHNFVYGVYSNQFYGFVPSTNYSLYCEPCGVYTIDQIQMLKRMIDTQGYNKELVDRCQYLLSLNEECSTKYPRTVDLLSKENVDKKDSIVKHYTDRSILNPACDCFTKQTIRHKITDAEINACVERNMSRYRSM